MINCTKFLKTVLIVFAVVLLTIVTSFSHGQSDDKSLFSIAWSSNGTKIAVGMQTQLSNVTEHYIKILDSETNSDLQFFDESPYTPLSLDWHSSDQYLLSASIDPSGFKVWDLNSRQVITSMQEGTQGTQIARWLPDGQILASGVSNVIRMYDSNSGERIRIVGYGTRFDPNQTGSRIVTSNSNAESYDGLHIYDLYGQDIPIITFGNDSLGYLVDWSPDNSFIASAHSDNTVRVWQAATGNPLSRFAINATSTIQWSLDSRLLAIGTNDGTVQIWDTLTQTMVETFFNPGAVRAIAWSPDGKRLAYGGDGTNGIVTIVTPDFSLVPTLTPTPAATPTAYQSPTPTVCDVYVNAGDTTLLIHKMEAANLSGEPVSICLSESTYWITEPYQEFFGKTAFPPVSGNITIVGDGATIRRDEEAQEDFRFFAVDNGGILKLSNLTLRDAELGSNAGAGVVNVTGTLIVEESRFINNLAYDGLARGGAIYNYNGTATVLNSSFDENEAAYGSGAIFSDGGAVTVSSSCFVGNTAQDNLAVGSINTNSVQAPGNWWGTASGPSAAGTGSGDGIGSNITFTPYLNSAPSFCRDSGGLATEEPTSEPFATDTETPVPTSTETPAPSPTPTLTPTEAPVLTPSSTPTPAPLARLRLTSMCSGDPAAVRVWRVRNPNPTETLITWEVVGTQQRGSLIVPASSDAFFETVAVSGPNMTRIFLNGAQQDVKASGGAVCPP